MLLYIIRWFVVEGVAYKSSPINCFITILSTTNKNLADYHLTPVLIWFRGFSQKGLLVLTWIQQMV